MSDILNYKHDDRPRRFGWAPGEYLGKCGKCEGRMIGDKRALICADCAYADWKPTHRHGKTGGFYRLREERVVIEATNAPAVLYESQDGTIWCRPGAEFYDGRFATLD